MLVEVKILTRENAAPAVVFSLFGRSRQNAAKTYIGIRETDKVRFTENDWVHLTRNAGLYDVILVDACQRLGVPFHLLTREFYELVKQRLTRRDVAAFNIIGGTQLYASTLLTLRAVSRLSMSIQ